MKGSRLLSTVIVIMAALLMEGCHLHQWEEATCAAPATCKICGATKGEPLEHQWEEPTCTEPYVCSVCGAREGEPLGHNWTEATCLYPATCAICGETTGETAPHVWIAANCIQPRHCAVCGLSEGSTLPHDWVDAGYNNPRTCSVCGLTEGKALTPYYLRNDFRFGLSTDADADYTTITGYDTSKATGKVRIKEYRTFNSDTGYEYKEGYEWREVTVEFSMDRPCRVMWGYTDSFIGLDEYARTDYITYEDGSREKIAAIESFKSDTMTAAGSDQSSSTGDVSSSGDSSSSGSDSSSSDSSSAATTPTPTPEPTSVPTPTSASEPGKYLLTAKQAVRVPVDYEGLVFYVCNADYEIDHTPDDTFNFFKMD
ncbi:MAG: hypothetical protein K5662_09530 [Lachnospiraceae bacterium]|nr:hypothetical protein [Lachnospiraceae bacterium]